MPIVQADRGDEIVFRPIPEDGTRLLALGAGEVDLYQRGPIGAELPRLEDDPSIGVDRVPAPSYNFVGLDTRAEPPGDVRMRQAIAHLIPREGIVGGVGQVGVSVRIYSDLAPARTQIAEMRLNELLAVGVDATVQAEESSAVFQRFSQTEDDEIMVDASNAQLDPDRGAVVVHSSLAPTSLSAR